MNITVEHTLTAKQRRFVEAYEGNATQAALAAGYSEKTARSQGQRLLTNVDIVAAVQSWEEKTVRSHIANREQRQKFWTSAMWNEELPMQVRLKASELLAKSEGDFLERMDLSNTDGSMRPVVAPPSPLAVMEELMRRCDEEEGDTNRLPSGIKVAM